jgi:hypothetical protein
MMTKMNCAKVQELLPGYLDGALPDSLGPDGHVQLGRHLQDCEACRLELERYRELSWMMSSTGPAAAPPADLGVSIRLAVADARASQRLAYRLNRLKTRIELLLDNILEPLALPASGGVVMALLVFAMVYQVLWAGAPLAAAVSDSPTNLLQPARLELLAGFQMSTLEEMTRTAGPLLVEATVDAQGEAVGYRVISGKVDEATRRELDQVVLFSRFRPEMSFGRPTSGGRVVLSFSQIRVRG